MYQGRGDRGGAQSDSAGTERLEEDEVEAPVVVGRRGGGGAQSVGSVGEVEAPVVVGTRTRTRTAGLLPGGLARQRYHVNKQIMTNKTRGLQLRHGISWSVLVN